MFQKQTFGASPSGFGTSTTPSFGSFKPATGTNAFGSPPAFGATATAQPATGGLFGSTNTTGGLFGSSTASTSAPAFGATTSGFGFGASTSTGGLFSNNQSTGLFGNTQNTSAFGAKPAGFGFGNTSATGTTSTGLFGSTPSTSTGLFGQQNTTLGGGGLFTNTGGAFGQQQQQAGTGHTKYNPVVGTDVIVKGGASQNVNIRHHCITCMKEYEGKSLEELRLEDYTAGRKGASTTGVFSGFQPTATDNKPLFGSTTFGQPATTSAPLFGGGLSTSTFGQTNTFAFGGGAQNQTTSTGLFANKPAFGTTTTPGTGIFGATVTTQTPTFGTSTPSFGGFGTNTQNQGTGLFGAKTAPAFGATPASSGFGGFGTASGVGLFAPKTQQTTAPTFASNTAAPFGNLSTGFGTNTSSSGFFSNLSKPTTTPLLGGQTQNTGFGAGLGTGLGTSFQAKPAVPAFGGLNTSFQQPQQNTFRMDGGLGGGIFGNNSTAGAGLSLGGFNSNTTAPLMGGSAANSGVHEQILTLAARPYGDSPLFKDLLPESASSAEEALKPTNPAALKAALDVSYKVASPSSGRLRLMPRPAVAHDKKSLFDGLEESDASLEDKLSLRPSRKRLVLRPNARPNDENVTRENDRSMEEQTSPSVANKDYSNVMSPGSNPVVSPRAQEPPRSTANEQKAVDNGLDVNSENNGNWLSGSKVSWADKEKQIENDTPRLYPNLDKEMPQSAERRASWLTTKPLRKPLASNPDAAENSIRELAVRPERTSQDKENLHSGSVSEEENAIDGDAPPHPTGIKLRRPGYYTIPTLDELTEYMTPDGKCVVTHFTIGRRNYGNVFYDCEMDVANLDLDALVHFMNKEVIIYPEDSEKPPVGEELNRRAVVTLDRVWPRDKTERRLIVEPERLLKMDYEGKLRRVCEKHDTKFIEYRPQTGSWVFRVEHFSKYGLTDSDEEDDPTPDVLKRQLIAQAHPPAAAVPKQSATLQTASPIGLGGLGGTNAPLQGLGGLGSLPTPSGMNGEELFSMQRTSLDLMNGSEKAYEMDTTEDSGEAPTLYPESLAFGVKSPTSELARLEHRQSHSVQLMKASLYADIDMEEAVSESTGDQLVPLGGTGSAPSIISRQEIVSRDDSLTVISQPPSEEAVMRPLVVRPHSVVLKYHRKVPPFKETIAGRLNASWLADMSVCRARHARLGFGPRGTLAYVTTHDSVADLPKSGDLSQLEKYISGRADDDWSESVVTRLALGQEAKNPLDVLPAQMESLFEFCEVVEDGECPKLVVSVEPQQRLRLLQQLLKHAESEGGDTYRLQVWQLCDALWAADLENDGVPGSDVQSLVLAHRRLLQWLRRAGDDVTRAELDQPANADPKDETDSHSGRVWTLLVGGRIVEACKVARDNGDLHMATILAQIAGEPSFQALVGKQLQLWRECGAGELISAQRLAALHLAAGLRPPEHLERLDWIRALHVTARYLCPQVPRLEHVVRTYESYFPQSDDSPSDMMELVGGDEMSMRPPLPPYCEENDRHVDAGGTKRRVLDLRYELLRAKAFNCRPKLQPAAYTTDPLDYSLSFLIGAWLDSPSTESIEGVAHQLEARGHWHLAMQALAHLPNSIRRARMMRAVLGRNAPSRGVGEEGRRLRYAGRLRLPRHWTPLAQAARAKYQHQPILELEHLVAAEQWNSAHRLLIEEIWTDVVLSDKIQTIKTILEKLNAAAEKHEIVGWESGGKALYHYMYVCDEVKELVSAAEEGMESQGRFEALQRQMGAACVALERLQTRGPAEGLARAEMGARLVQLSSVHEEMSRGLGALLAALRLPPDCAAHALHKFSCDVAEHASELCLDSPPPPPSHPQAMRA